MNKPVIEFAEPTIETLCMLHDELGYEFVINNGEITEVICE